MKNRMGSRQARQSFSNLLGRVHYGGEEVIVERAGKPMAAVIPVDVYERMVTERNAPARKGEHHPQVARDDMWAVLGDLTGTVEAPSDGADQHDHYLYGTPKRSNID